MNDSVLDPVIENEIRQRLRRHFLPIYGERVDTYIEGLLALDHHRSRFEHFQSIVGSNISDSASRTLVSGFGAGSEMVLARQFGLGEIFGVEVEEFWVDICKSRLCHLSGMHPVYYTGDLLPYVDDYFDIVVSSHIIEHTRIPQLYLRECVRVLRPSGYLLLEFPTRYHHTELHTLLPSFEWLPHRLRNAVLRLLSSRISPLKTDVKSRYISIVTTHLQQISMGGVRRFLRQVGYPYDIVYAATVAPGIVRCVTKKSHRNSIR